MGPMRCIWSAAEFGLPAKNIIALCLWVARVLLGGRQRRRGLPHGRARQTGRPGPTEGRGRDGIAAGNDLFMEGIGKW